MFHRRPDRSVNLPWLLFALVEAFARGAQLVLPLAGSIVATAITEVKPKHRLEQTARAGR